MQTAYGAALSPGELCQDARVGRRSTHIKNISLLQPFVGRNAVVRIGGKDHSAAAPDHFLNQKQNAIERKAETKSIDPAVNVDQISCAQAELIAQNVSK